MSSRISPPFLALFAAAALGTAPLSAQEVTRVSIHDSGTQTDRASNRPSIDDAGRYVAFESNATNLVAGDFNFVQDVFVKDLQTGAIVMASLDSSGAMGNGESKRAVISGDGTKVVFISIASNFAAGDTNATYDIFVHDLLTGTTSLCSKSTAGVLGDGLSTRPSLSADGSVVAFRSLSTNLVAGDTNLVDDVFVHDVNTGITERISVSSAGLEGNATSDRPSISADGRWVTFYSDASNLVAGDTNFLRDVFLHDRTTGVTTRISTDGAGVQANGLSTRPSISDDGILVAFRSDASNLMAGDLNGWGDVFVKDLATGQIELVSRNTSGVPANALSSVPTISGDGRFVSYRSLASDLVAGDTNGAEDVFLYDRTAKTTARISESSSGIQGNGDSTRPFAGVDGSKVVFQSLADNLVVLDTNLFEDVFLWDLGGAPSKNTIALVGPGTHMVGTRLTLNWDNAPPSSPYWLLYSFNVNGKIAVGHCFDVGDPVTILATGRNDATGAASFTTPPIPAGATGRTVYFEVAARESSGAFKDSNPLAVAFF